MKIHAFGDSFVMGDQDDYSNSMTKPDIDTKMNWQRYNVSFSAVIAQELGAKLTNYAIRGSGNYPQLDELWIAVHDKLIAVDDVVLFGITAVGRDRVALKEFDKATGLNYGPCMVKRDLINNFRSDLIGSMDYYYIMSVLQALKRTFGLKLVIFNCFESPLAWVPQQQVNMIDQSDLMLNQTRGNTLVDILNDTWGQLTNHPYHVNLVVPTGYEHLYTTHKHPSVAGHKKIAQWFLQNIPELAS